MVCRAPVFCSSGGRSAVSRIRGNFFLDASMTAGKASAAAVPEVNINAAGFPAPATYPAAWNARPLSSTWTKVRAFRFRDAADIKGAERDPGERQK